MMLEVNMQADRSWTDLLGQTDPHTVSDLLEAKEESQGQTLCLTARLLNT